MMARDWSEYHIEDRVKISPSPERELRDKLEKCKKLLYELYDDVIIENHQFRLIEELFPERWDSEGRDE